MISVLKNTIFVFGSNTEGRHGAGAALFALKNCGATYGQPEGLQGRSYAIITKEIRKHMPIVTLQDVEYGVHKLLLYAEEHPELKFVVSRIGGGLAGFSDEHIAPLFRDITPNVVIPTKWREILNGTR